MKDDLESGALFSRVYLREESVLRDSERFRRRLHAWFSEHLYKSDIELFSSLVKQELGASISSSAYATQYQSFFLEAPVRDVLDCISLLYAVLRDGRTADLREFVARVFKEECLGYTLNKAGAVRFAVDAEYERNRFAIIDGMGAQKFAAVRTAVESAFARLDQQPPDTKGAVRDMFEGAETLAKLLADVTEDLDEGMVRKRIKPIAHRKYTAKDESSIAFADQMLESFIKWVNAGHKYRHGPKTEEPRSPPLELAVAYVSNGAGYIRFLIDLAS